MLAVRQDGSESPQQLQIGGLSAGISCQQGSQTAPRVGARRGPRQAAQSGARRTAMSASQASVAHFDAVRVTPQPFE